MNIKNKLFLGIMLISTAGLMQAMERTDAEILDDIVSISYEKRMGQGGRLREFWNARLSDGRSFTFQNFFDGPQAGEYSGMGMTSDLAPYFSTPESKKNAVNYLRQKYNEQESSHKLTQ